MKLIDTGACHASSIFYRPHTGAHKPRPATVEEITRLYTAIAPLLTISMSPRPFKDFDGRGALWRWSTGKRPYEVIFFPVRWEIDRSTGKRALTLREFCEFYGLNVL